MSAQPGFTAHVSTLGHGPRRALALHCTMAFGKAWGGVSSLLDGQLTLVAPDMPSHGKSPDWDESSDFPDTVYEASMTALDAGPMDVIGHSFGAVTALRMAVEHPARIRSLTLFEPVFFAVAVADAPETVLDDDENLAKMGKAIASGDYTGAARSFNQMWATGSTWDDLPERSRKTMAQTVHVVPGQRAFLYEDTRGLMEPGRMEAVTAPTLVMRGALSLPAINAVNAGLARRLGNATEVVIDGAGHMAPISHPEPVARAIAALLARS